MHATFLRKFQTLLRVLLSFHENRDFKIFDNIITILTVLFMQAISNHILSVATFATKGFSVPTFVMIRDECDVFIIRNQFLNNCLSPPNFANNKWKNYCNVVTVNMKSDKFCSRIGLRIEDDNPERILRDFDNTFSRNGIVMLTKIILKFQSVLLKLKIKKSQGWNSQKNS